MNARELRRFLFDIDKQELTVADLRAILYKVEDQDKQISGKAVDFYANPANTTEPEPEHKREGHWVAKHGFYTF